MGGMVYIVVCVGEKKKNYETGMMGIFFSSNGF